MAFIVASFVYLIAYSDFYVAEVGTHKWEGSIMW